MWDLVPQRGSNYFNLLDDGNVTCACVRVIRPHVRVSHSNQHTCFREMMNLRIQDIFRRAKPHLHSRRTAPLSKGKLRLSSPASASAIVLALASPAPFRPTYNNKRCSCFRLHEAGAGLANSCGRWTFSAVFIDMRFPCWEVCAIACLAELRSAQEARALNVEPTALDKRPFGPSSTSQTLTMQDPDVRLRLNERRRLADGVLPMACQHANKL